MTLSEVKNPFFLGSNYKGITETYESVFLRSFLQKRNTKIDLNQIFSKYLNFVLFEIIFQMVL